MSNSTKNSRTQSMATRDEAKTKTATSKGTAQHTQLKHPSLPKLEDPEQKARKRIDSFGSNDVLGISTTSAELALSFPADVIEDLPHFNDEYPLTCSYAYAYYGCARTGPELHMAYLGLLRCQQHANKPGVCEPDYTKPHGHALPQIHVPKDSEKQKQYDTKVCPKCEAKAQSSTTSDPLESDPLTPGDENKTANHSSVNTTINELSEDNSTVHDDDDSLYSESPDRNPPARDSDEVDSSVGLDVSKSSNHDLNKGFMFNGKYVHVPSAARYERNPKCTKFYMQARCEHGIGEVPKGFLECKAGHHKKSGRETSCIALRRLDLVKGYTWDGTLPGPEQPESCVACEEKPNESRSRKPAEVSSKPKPIAEKNSRGVTKPSSEDYLQALGHLLGSGKTVRKG